jgi:hypothetical protein
MYSKTQQAEHCSQLAKLLGKISPSEYHHGTYHLKNYSGCGTVACALGWAAEKGIGNLFLHSCSEDNTAGTPRFITAQGASLNPAMAAEEVFGKNSFEEIFSTNRNERMQVPDYKYTDDRGRADSIKLLLERAARLRAEASEETLRLEYMPA